jgi:tRNA-2-methylthio-N6-dimethylallyladenosine synthase
VREVREVFEQGYREVTLLGQNVNSYSWNGQVPVDEPLSAAQAQGSARTESRQLPVYINNNQAITPNFPLLEARQKPINFATLIEMVASIDPLLRVRYSTSHPKDLSDDVLEVMAKHDNICKHIHLPVQSGSSSVLQRMNRKYSREWYLDRIAAINRILPGCAISTDIIAGFCGETEEEHNETLSLMREVGFDFAYMFKYSERPGTKASRHMKDDVPDEVKTRRLNEIIALQNELSALSKKADVGRTFEVLVEGQAKRPSGSMMGRTSGNKVVVFEATDVRPGDYVKVKITRATSATLIGNLIT